MEDEARTCLVISDGRRGIENQALGLAEACSRLRPLSIQTHNITHGKAISALPPKAQLRVAKFDLPACDIAIGCGRQAIAALLHLKRAQPDVMTIYVQDPRLDPSAFDLVIAPEHDPVRGKNVISIIGSPNRITEMKIIGETLNFAEGLSALSMPRTAMLVGGDSKSHKLDRASHDAHIEIAKSLHNEGQSLLITTSRRTPDFAITQWKRFASDMDRVWLHQGEGPNPYFAFLGGADQILVTEDSTNMLTEACALGKPVYRLPMAGAAGKFQTLYDSLKSRCGVVSYEDRLEQSDFEPLDETSSAAQHVWARWDQRG